MSAVHTKLERAATKVKDLEGALAVLADLQAAQDGAPDDHALWELRLRLLRSIGKLLPAKHTGHGGAASRGRQGVERRLAYKARLLAGVRAARFERILRDWKKAGQRPRVQAMVRLARQERGEDPELLLKKASAAIDDLARALVDNPKNERALGQARRALERLDLSARASKGKA